VSSANRSTWLIQDAEVSGYILFDGVEEPASRDVTSAITLTAKVKAATNPKLRRSNGCHQARVRQPSSVVLAWKEDPITVVASPPAGDTSGGGIGCQ
jgi:hypothetical protein